MFSAEHGTLVVCLVWRDGIYVAADSRRSKLQNDADKIVRLGPQTIIGIRGQAMLDDPDTGEAILASTFLQDDLQGPITVERYAPHASWQDRDKAGEKAALTVRDILAQLVDAYVHEWNKVEIAPDSLARIGGDEAMLGLTVVQWEPDDWCVAIDLKYQIAFDDATQIVIRPERRMVLQNGPFTRSIFKPFLPPCCDFTIPPPQDAYEPVPYLEAVFKGVIDASTRCAEDIGLPTDIAKTYQGTVTPLVMKHPWPLKV